MEYPQHTKYVTDWTLNQFSRKRQSGDKKTRSRSVISTLTDERFIERLTDDLQGLAQLLKSREKDQTPQNGEEDSDKRDSSTNGNQRM